MSFAGGGGDGETKVNLEKQYERWRGLGALQEENKAKRRAERKGEHKAELSVASQA